jgi:hypothetical protein
LNPGGLNGSSLGAKRIEPSAGDEGKAVIPKTRQDGGLTTPGCVRIVFAEYDRRGGFQTLVKRIQRQGGLFATQSQETAVDGIGFKPNVPLPSV